MADLETPADPDEIRVRHDADARRYVAEQGGATLGHLAYRPRGADTWVFTHTEVDPQYEGRGAGTALVRFALADVRARGVLVDPKCPFVAIYFKRHPEERDLLAPESA